MSNTTNRVGLFAAAAAFGTATLLSFSAIAEDFPSIDVTISTEIESDYTHKSDDKSTEINDLFLTVEPSIDVHLTRGFSIHTDLVMESVRDPRPFKDREFEDIGLFVETLFLNYEFGDLTIFAGKINPSFGIAWDATPVVYGADFAEDYELTERIGGGFSYKMMPTGGGEHVLTVNAFFADRSALSNSAFTKRGRNRRANGGASNTSGPESFSATLDGSELPTMPGLSYHLGVRAQKKGRGDSGSETGFAAGLQKEFNLGNEQKVEALFEVAHFNNLDGGADDISYVTVGAAYSNGPWDIATSGTFRRTDVNGGSKVNDRLFQLSGGYEFDNCVTLDVGYKIFREASVDSHTVGILLTKEFSFSR